MLEVVEIFDRVRSMKLVILDRDGVINEDSETFIKSPEEWHALPGSLDAIARLGRGGWRVVVATNQSGLRRKLFDIGALTRIHAKMHRQLAEVGGHVEAIFICPCTDQERCTCRKPNPGMLNEIAERLFVSLDNVPYIGDKGSDLRAARAAGAQPWLVRTGNGAAVEREGKELDGVRIFDDLPGAVDALLNEQASSS
jgi:D-glycero-D-manno-heptose 1,7-bisphosphate phosphatase